MAKKASARRARPHPKSSFLSLPAELRNKMYQYALVRHQPIDLWPHKWIKEEAKEPSEEAPSTPYNLKTRHQADLEYVRKEMSTGLLGTCSQVYREAAPMFWGTNTWRFSGRSGWQGLLRFFLSIGPEARARIKRLDVHAPVYMRWPVKDSDNKDLNGRSKNRPKMHMVKLLRSEGHLDREAIQRIVAMLSMDRTVEEINFIIPDGFRNGDEDSFSGYDIDHDMQPDSRLRLQKIQELDFVRKQVVVESGGYLAVYDGASQILKQGWDLLCQPGSFIWERVKDKEGFARHKKVEVTKTRQLVSPARQFDYLDGVQTLWQDSSVSVHANAGRQKKAKPLKPRHLKAFGGCRFIRDGTNILPIRDLSDGELQACH